MHGLCRLCCSHFTVPVSWLCRHREIRDRLGRNRSQDLGPWHTTLNLVGNWKTIIIWDYSVKMIVCVTHPIVKSANSKTGVKCWYMWKVQVGRTYHAMWCCFHDNPLPGNTPFVRWASAGFSLREINFCYPISLPREMGSWNCMVSCTLLLLSPIRFPRIRMKFGGKVHHDMKPRNYDGLHHVTSGRHFMMS